MQSYERLVFLSISQKKISKAESNYYRDLGSRVKLIRSEGRLERRTCPGRKSIHPLTQTPQLETPRGKYQYAQSSNIPEYEDEMYRGEFNRSSTPYQYFKNSRRRTPVMVLGEKSEKVRSNIAEYLMNRMDEQPDTMFDADEIDMISLNWLWHAVH